MIWFLLKCLEVVFIRVKIKGYLKNITENELCEFEEKGIKNKNKITYANDNIKNTIKINDNVIMLIRDGNDFVNTFVFNKDNSYCNYLLKDNLSVYSLLVSLLGYIPVFIGGYLVTNNGKLLNFENDKRTNATNAIIIFIFMDYALNVVTCMLQMIFNVGDIAILVGNLCLSFIWMCVILIAYMLLNKKTRI